jgi:ATP-binding cassette subfamily B protein/ATP-binding cassette subfamily C protein
MNIPLRQYWSLLANHIKPQKGHFTLLTALLFGSIGLQIVNPQIMRTFIDLAKAGATMEPLVIAAVAFISITLVQQVVSVSATYVGENVAWNATNALREELARHCLGLDMSFHNDTSPGELIERIDGDVTELSNFFSQLVVRVIGNLLLMAGIVTALLLENWRVGLPAAASAALALVVLNRIRGLAIPHDKALRAANADLFGFLEERLAGTEDIRSSGAVDFVVRGLYGLHQAILDHWRKAAMMHWVLRSTGGVLMLLVRVTPVVVSFFLFRSGAITIGTAYLIVSYTNLLVRPIREINQQVENLQNIGASTERLSDLRAIQSKIKDGSSAQIPSGPLALTFDSVSFSYIDEEPVLDDVSFTLEPGSVLGLLGRTGSGKTTLARLVFRLYDPTMGQVRLGGTGINKTRLVDLRQRVAIVTQDVQLFQASVRDNITFFDASIPDARIHTVIEKLELTEWYQSLAHGLDTRLETGGRGLSAGEAQLLAFTRVFLRDPGLVILDEASSRLDPVTEHLIERAVDKLLANRTAIIIAHRLGTIHRADEIIILEQGRMIEHGHREQLIADPSSRFYHLLQTGLEEVLA